MPDASHTSATRVVHEQQKRDMSATKSNNTSGTRVKYFDFHNNKSEGIFLLYGK